MTSRQRQYDVSLILVSLVLAGCAAQSAGRPINTTGHATPCDAAPWHSAAAQAPVDTLKMTPARALSVFVPPMPTPAGVRGSLVEVWFVVGADGKLDSDSTRMCGLPSNNYAYTWAKVLGAMTFAPATVNGAPIRSRVVIRFQL